MEKFNETYLDIPLAAKYLKIPESTFRKKVAQRFKGIPFVKFGRKIIFKRNLLDSWAERLMLSKLNY